MHEQPIGNFGKQEMACKREEHAEAEGLQGMLATDDRGPQDA
jgi:hypothetical protein